MDRKIGSAVDVAILGLDWIFMCFKETNEPSLLKAFIRLQLKHGMTRRCYIKIVSEIKVAECFNHNISTLKQYVGK